MNGPTEERLRDALRQLEVSVETAKLGLWRLDLGSGRLEWNDRQLLIYGIAREDFGGHIDDWRRRVHPDDAEHAAAGLAPAFQGHKVFDVRYRIVRPTGEIRHVSAASTPVCDSDGHIRELIGVNVDRTDQHRQQTRMREREAFLRAIFDNGHTAMVVTDETGHYVSANRAAAILLGYPVERLLRMNVRDLLTPLQDAGEQFEAYRAKGHQDGEFEFIRPDGEPRVAKYNATRMDNGLHLSILTDITESRRVEHQLQHAQKMEALGRLAGGISHDFNNALMVINNHAQMIQESVPQDAPLRDLVEPIRHAGERAAALVRQLLLFSRQAETQKSPLDLNGIVRNVELMLNHIIKEHVQVECELAETLSPVVAHAGQLEQVVMNLVLNARDALSAGGTLSLKTQIVAATHPDDDEPKSFVTLIVTDDGVGMTEETISHIFEPFFSTKAVGRGSGLGLATAYGIVKEAGGFLKSRVSRGSARPSEFSCPPRKLNCGPRWRRPRPGRAPGRKARYWSSRTSRSFDEWWP